MNPASLLQILPGPFNFLRPDAEELRRVLPDFQRLLPVPRLIFLEDESATPFYGFPVLLSPGFKHLRTALGAYIEAEIALQMSGMRREAPDPRAHKASWERYRNLLSRAVENVTMSSYGRHYPAVFWLHHSLDLARHLSVVPRRLLREDTQIGRQHGDAIKYRLLDRFLDRVFTAIYDLIQKIAGATEDVEEELFPRLLTRMRDNVLLFTEDYIGPDLQELSSYFNGSLQIDGRDLRSRLEELRRWHEGQLQSDDELRGIATHLLRADPRTGSRELLHRPGYVSFLATRPSWDPARLLPPPFIQVWESLLLKLKEFELLHSIRRLVVPIERREGRILTREPPGGRLVFAGELYLSPSTRPMDFLEAWVVDPRIDRFGLIYDISEFSQTLSVLHRSGTDKQDDGFRSMFRFQRRVNRLALAHRTKLEKYLGDGAFFSSREARNLLACSVHMQRYYVAALAEGLPFDRGLRIALNFGSYRLIPMGAGPEEGERYEFFGPGLVELTRLTTGKATQEIDEVKTMLISQGYPESAVHRFFAPMSQGDVDVVDKGEESRRFYAYINRNGTLHNNGMVATGAYVEKLEREVGHIPLQLGVEGNRSYIVFQLEDAGERLPVGIRKLGLAVFKGLGKLPVYEIVDAGAFAADTLKPIQGLRLLAAIDRQATPSMARTVQT